MVAHLALPFSFERPARKFRLAEFRFAEIRVLVLRSIESLELVVA